MILVLTLGQLPLTGAFSPVGGAVSQDSPRDPRFGVVEAFWDADAAVEAGVAWERILFQWSQLQPHSPDDWNTLHVPDEWLQWARSQGREVVGLLKNTPYWATDADPPMEASPPRGLDLPIDDPGNLWAAFVRRAVTFYGERGVHRWIIWNEPDISPGVYGQEWAGSIDQYYRSLKVAYRVIKEVDPDAIVHLAGLTYWHDPDWLREFLAVASADPEGANHGYFFDIVSLHIYFQTHTVDSIVNHTRGALAAYGLNKPIWINETNASPDADPQWPLVRPRWRVDLREQASFILQSFALGLAAGAERIAVYRLMDAGLPPGGEPFGLLRPDHSRRPAYAAFRMVTQHYAGTTGARIDRQPLTTQVTLDQGGRTTRVLWARTGTDVAVTVPALAPQATLLDQEGNAQMLDGSGGGYALTLPGARCADETLGCIIGGPTYLLIEEAASGEAGAPDAQAVTSTAEARPTLQGTAVTTITSTLRPTVPAATAPPTHTQTISPSAPPPATPTFSPTPTTTPTQTATTTPSPTASPSPTVSATLTPSTSLSATPSPPATLAPTMTLLPVSGEDTSPSGRVTLMVGLALLLGLLVLLVWRTTRG